MNLSVNQEHELDDLIAKLRTTGGHWVDDDRARRLISTLLIERDEAKAECVRLLQLLNGGPTA